MAGSRGRVKLAVTIVGLVLLCVVAYQFLLYLVTPHPPHVDYPVPSDLPPGAEVHEGGYIVMPHNASNYTAASGGGLEFIPAYNVSLTPEQAASAETGGADGTVSFFELPLWIQLYALPSILFGIVTSFLAAALVVRHIKKHENDNKRGVLTYIRGNPGCTAPELARGRNMNIGTARYHIQRLQEEGRIVLEKIGKYSRIFVNSHTYDDREKLIASHLRGDSSRLIIATLMETPGVSNQMLSEKLGMEKSLAYRYMQRLLEDGIVTFEREGKHKLYYIDPAAKEVLIKLMPLHYQCPGLKRE
jgi:predicted transcriptional regulator